MPKLKRANIRIIRGRGRPVETPYLVLKTASDVALLEWRTNNVLVEKAKISARNEDFRTLRSFKNFNLSEHLPTGQLCLTIFGGIHPVRKILDQYELEELGAIVNSILYRKNESILAELSAGYISNSAYQAHIPRIELGRRMCRKIMEYVKRYYDDKRHTKPIKT